MVSIGPAAARLGVTPQAMRKWEHIGLVPRAQRLPGSRFRLYSESDLETIRDRVNTRRQNSPLRERLTDLKISA